VARPLRSASLLLGACVVALVLAPNALAAPAERAFALSGSNLLSFDPAAPGTVTTKAVTGVQAGEGLVGIDVRPQNGMLYGLGVNATTNTATLYTIGRETGAAGVVGVAGTIQFTTNGATVVDLPTGEYGFDFNPAADRVRVSTATGRNFRVNPNTGAPVDGDNTGLTSGTVTGTNPDGSINGATTSVSGSAYTNDRPNTGVTTLYTLSAASDALTIQNPPNTGTETMAVAVTEGGLPLNFTAAGGFDIDPAVNAAASNVAVTSGSGYAALTVGGTTRLYTIDLVSGAATSLGTIGTGAVPVQGLALQRDLDDAGFPVVGLGASGTTLVRFQTKTPGTSTTQALGAIGAGETMVAVAWRPQTGQLYGLGVNAGSNAATLYLIDPQTGVATVVGGAGGIAYTNGAGTPIDLPPASSGWGIDFNPTADRVRIVAGGGLNARANPTNGAPVDGDFGAGGGSVFGVNPDGPHNGMSAGGIGASAASYTNAYTQTLTGGPTTLYVLDPGSNQLAIQTPPNAGTLTSGRPVTEAGSALDFTPSAGLDIPGEVGVSVSNSAATGSAIALLKVGGVDRIYNLNLATGAATALGTAPGGLSDLAVGDAQRGAPEPGPGPGPGPTPTDTTVDGAVVDLAKKLTVKGKELKVKLAAGCAEACTWTASGAVLDKRAKKPAAKAKSYPLAPATAASAAGQKATLKLKLKGSKSKRRKQTRKIAAAIRRGDKVKATISVQFADEAGNSAGESASAKLKAKR
jgi:hypothetical protein